MKTYKYKMYSNHGNRELHKTIDAFAEVWNHCIALQRRYYRIHGKYISKYALQKQIAKLKKIDKFAHWHDLGSQAIQEVVSRIDKGYQLFFHNLKHSIKTRPPQFKARRKYKSFTLKQAGWKWLGNGFVRIGKRIYRYFNSRAIEGSPKTLTIKRDAIGDIYIFVVTDAEDSDLNGIMTGQSAGFDFGLKTYLTASDGNDIESPQLFNRSRQVVKQASRKHSKKRKRSNNRERAQLHLARQHKQITNRREDFHWKLAHQLTDAYDHLSFETLNLKGMKSLWGRKASDLGYC